MMTPEQVATVTRVYRKFVENDSGETEWTPIDESMSILEWLSDEELTIESELILLKLQKGNPRCAYEHPGKECFVPLVMDAVQAIIDLYKETQTLHFNNRFILQYYMTLSSIGAIRA